MRIKFHGAIGTVTGSCYELYDEREDIRFLVDCGMKQGEDDAEEWNGRPFPFDSKSLDFVVLTHAHLDHCGLIPLLYKRGFKGEIYCTKETAELAKIVLKDACKHSELFSKKDVANIQWRQHGGESVLRTWHEAKGDIRFRYLRSAHVLGATSVEFWWGKGTLEKKILFSGDIGNNRRGEEFQPLMRHAMLPDCAGAESRYVVMESTYGARDMKPNARCFDHRLAQLRSHIAHTVRHKQGTLVIPCFAVNRTQDVLFDLHYLFASHRELKDIPVYFDAKMAGHVNKIYAGALGRMGSELEGYDVSDKKPLWLNERLFDWMSLDSNNRDDRYLLLDLLQEMLVADITIAGERKKSRSKIVRRWRRVWRSANSGRRMEAEVGGPCIVVTGGGMCDGGPVVNYLKKLARDERHTFLLTGYCAPSTNGGKLQMLAEKSAEERRDLADTLRWERGQVLPCSAIQANIERIRGYSGHADRKRLIDWLFPSNSTPRRPVGSTVFLTHGNDDAREALRKSLRCYARRLTREEGGIQRNLSIELPKPESGWFDLEAGHWLDTARRSVTAGNSAKFRIPALI